MGWPDYEHGRNIFHFARNTEELRVLLGALDRLGLCQEPRHPEEPRCSRCVPSRQAVREALPGIPPPISQLIGDYLTSPSCDRRTPPMCLEQARLLNQQSSSGHTPLMSHTVKANVQMVKMLVMHGVDLNLTVREGGLCMGPNGPMDTTTERTALDIATHKAAWSGYLGKQKPYRYIKVFLEAAMRDATT